MLMLPTPNTVDAKGGSRRGKGQVQLCHLARKGMLMFPTPAAHPPGWRNITVVDKDGKPPEHGNQRFYDAQTGRLVQKGLEQVVAMFPTPKKLLSDTEYSKIAGQLNADWVSILMGFPADWTVVEDGNAECQE